MVLVLQEVDYFYIYLYSWNYYALLSLFNYHALNKCEFNLYSLQVYLFSNVLFMKCIYTYIYIKVCTNHLLDLLCRLQRIIIQQYYQFKKKTNYTFWNIVYIIIVSQGCLCVQYWLFNIWSFVATKIIEIFSKARR